MDYSSRRAGERRGSWARLCSAVESVHALVKQSSRRYDASGGFQQFKTCINGLSGNHFPAADGGDSNGEKTLGVLFKSGNGKLSTGKIVLG